jgi:divinyl protochlorophyllide a 8-vinyl-reductase
MPDGSSPHAPDGAAGRIGPNAVWQLLPLLERVGGAGLCKNVLASAGLFDTVPGGGSVGLIDERPVARLHRCVRDRLGELAPSVLHEAGVRTADYILANRIPAPARWALTVLPDRLAAPALSRAIARNAWTFAGSGRFSVLSTRPVRFALANNPLIRGERSDQPLCHWHVGVFERLFRVLVNDRLRVQERACCACGNNDCRFEIAVSGTA